MNQVTQYAKTLIKKLCKDYNLNESEVLSRYFPEIEISDIDSFCISNRNKNDESNKTRENIIVNIINKKIPQGFFDDCPKWKKLSDDTWTFIRSLTSEDIDTIKAVSKGGRKFNYDIEVKINNEQFNIELKNNASGIDETPQFVSPMKTEKYLSSSYELFFYNNYLPNLVEATGFSLPGQIDYLKNVHSSEPSCVIDFQKLYYQGCKKSSRFSGDEKAINFYNLSQKLSKESIKEFINNNDLLSDVLTTYLQTSQNNKIYMMYKDGRFYKETVNMNEYEIESWQKQPEKFRYQAITKTGKTLNILLRWKNGDGIAFPAFQIKSSK